MFSKLLPNQQLQSRHLQQLNQPILIPQSVQLSTMSSNTQALANFLVEHLQSQQGQLATLTRDMYGMKDIVWAGGLVLQKQQKQLHSLNDTVLGHESSIEQLRDELLQQEARLRTEIIFQQQQQAIQRVQFNLKQRQTRIDNIFDGIILIVALLVTGSSPISTVNSTLSSLLVSSFHLFLRYGLDRHPYTLTRLNPPEPATSSTQPLSTPTSTISPITQAQQQFGTSPTWSQWNSQPLLHTNPNPVEIANIKQPVVALKQVDMYYKRRFRKGLVFSSLRFIQTVYLFLVLRKVLIKWGFIQSPLTEYIRAVLPVGFYNFLSQLSYTNMKKNVVDLGTKVFTIDRPKMGLKDPTPDGTGSEIVDTNIQIDEDNTPMTKDEIYDRVFSNLKQHPDLTHPHCSTLNQDQIAFVNDGNTQTKPNPLDDHKPTSPPQSPIPYVSLTKSTLTAVLPSWAAPYVTPIADQVVSTLNPFINPYENHHNPYLDKFLHSQEQSQTSTNNPSDTANNHHPYGYDFTTRQLLRDPSLPWESVPTAPRENDIAESAWEDEKKRRQKDHNAGLDRITDNKASISAEDNLDETDGKKKKDNFVMDIFHGITDMFDSVFFD